MLFHTAAMSITGLSDTNKLYAKSFHRWNDSGELDVFEAARYFSGATHEVSCHNGTATTTTFAQKVMREELQETCRGRGGRASLDLPMISSLASSHTTTSTSHANAMDNQMMKEKIKYKQPSSPAGRLASFLNSLFSQANSKKKKKSKSTTQSLKDEDESPSGRRRRSSISHFRSASTADSKSIYSSSSSGFRTPPSYAHTPTKITTYKDLRSYSDHKQLGYPSVKYNSTMVHDDKRNIDLAWLEDKFRFSGGLITEKKKELGSGFLEKCSSDDHQKDKILMRKLNDQVAVDDDGADSDSSSDLFELQNYDLGNYYSNDLPVYETTHIDSIKRGAPISTAAI